ncbi:DUF4199 domain-containing protein [Marinilongibacter aquaticus]|uniref:DUF4199 domain-containing protein n=1 Tax=Marinilongibacter aquaticus TaxID=2975157 RepID=UPI0021BD0AF5|nr:DUF4199 domain-containing protein [Marinilongibacter aquaticus]UBM57951.1 DUF4199 domain-containing protein [Marinilongibacter aquaticus]
MANYKIEIKWALIFIAALLLWMLLEKLSGLHSTHIDKHMYLTNLFAIPSIWIYVLALKELKRVKYKGRMTFKQGLLSGVIMTLLIAALSPLSQYIVSYWITPEYFPNVIAYAVETGYYKTIEEAQAYFNYRNYAIQSTIWAIIMGTITAAIVSTIIRTRKSALEIQ